MFKKIFNKTNHKYVLYKQQIQIQKGELITVSDLKLTNDCILMVEDIKEQQRQTNIRNSMEKKKQIQIENNNENEDEEQEDEDDDDDDDGDENEASDVVLPQQNRKECLKVKSMDMDYTGDHDLSLEVPIVTETLQSEKKVTNKEFTQEIGKNYKIQNEKRGTVIQLVKEGSFEELQQFLGLSPENQENHPTIIKKQLFHSRNQFINLLDERGMNAFHWSIKLEMKEKQDLLLSHPLLDINQKTRNGYTPLTLCVKYNNLDLMKALLERKDIEETRKRRDIKGSVFHQACLLQAVKAIDLLIAQRVCPFTLDTEDLSAIHYASDYYIQNTLQQYMDQLNPPDNEYSQLDKPPVVFGYVQKISQILNYKAKRLIVLDPFSGVLMRYKKKTHFPQNPRQVTFINTILSIKRIESNKYWYLNKNMHYFEIVCSKEKQVLGCNYESTALQWVSLIYQAQNYFNEFSSSQFDMSHINKNNNYALLSVEGEIKELLDNAHQKNVQIYKQTANEFELKNNVDWNKLYEVENETIRSAYSYREGKEIGFLGENINNDTVLQLNDFEIIKEVGNGAFGTVYLVRKKNTIEEIYAMKVLFKASLILKRKLRYAVAESNILKSCNHPFILKLHYAFQTPKNLYLILDYCSRGDLLFHLLKKGKFAENEAKFYIGELILAIEYLHNANILYRDLKPENIFIDQSGHIKLGDFGLSKENITADDNAKSFCGSPAYLSPEMVQKKGATRASDIYGIGAILFELVTGSLPFYEEDFEKLYQKIESADVNYPKHVSNECRDLIEKLMAKDPEKRLGVDNKQQIYEHPFFQDMDFTLLYQKKYLPPQMDYTFNMDDVLSNLNENVIHDKDYEEKNMTENRLKNFTFVRKNENDELNDQQDAEQVTEDQNTDIDYKAI